MKKMLIALVLVSAAARVASADTLSLQTINDASLEAIAVEKLDKPGGTANPSIVRLQILLDRAGSSPGVIDGLYGDNVVKAVRGFEALRALPVDGKLDPEVIAQLGDSEPAATTYQITSADLDDLIEEIPEDFAKQAALKHLGYTSVVERLSERFHMDIDLIKAMNPTSRFKEGDAVIVAANGSNRSGAVKRIDAHRKTGQVFAYGEDEKLLAVYPATIGSEDNPTPSGKHKVKGVARMPQYTYNPKVNFQQGNNTKVLELPGGPNSPVGTMWIDLSEPTYGIHGTPEPSLIDKVGSHGCVRLTNWDVDELASMVKPGVVVDIME